ncbi:MAG TPA: MBL fold metallo-hydrolase [Candidatus Limnocylindria bacterium]|nr:MBL fold metallo-hydrolase [Candidatus Limnocylindria bacterium]
MKGQARTQAQVAVSPIEGTWLLLNASPDLREQLSDDPEFAPYEKTRSTPIAAIILTSADVDCVLGLLHLREFQPLRIYSTPSVRRALTEENTLFRTLERSNPPSRWETLPLNRRIPVFQPAPHAENVKLFCKAVPLGGNFPDYVSDGLRRNLDEEEAVIGLEFVQNEKRFFYAPTLSGRGGEWRRCVSESDIALLDGTFWSDDEMIKIHGSGKTARGMGHLPLSGEKGLLEQLQLNGNVRRVLIHLNNTNPTLDPDSAASRTVRDAGWEIAHDGMEFEL